MKRTATAVWSGNGTEGKGTISSLSGVLTDTPYSFAARFKSEDGKMGTNPEELIAAAHSACFTMALSFGVAGAGFDPTELKTKATVTVENVDGGFAITAINLALEGKVAGITAEQFSELAHGAKAGCPVSKALAAVPITLDVKLVELV